MRIALPVFWFVFRRLLVAAALLALVVTLLSVTTDHGVLPGDVANASAAKKKRKDGPNPVTPGDFTGYGFDQCHTPNQATMNTWLKHSPFLAVGIYISGDSRACRDQPNLTPAWVSTQLANGWRLLPITLGPQASCQPRFPRYNDDFKIDPTPGAGKYSKARSMGQVNAQQTLVDAQALGLVPGSTLWYDLEGFDGSNKNCRESALAFLSAWNSVIKAAGFVAGVYSSAGSGIKVLDDARVNRPGAFTLPDQIWMARWDGVANTSTSYIREDGWRPGNRIKQFRGGHDEVWGGVRINIDSNFLDVGLGSVAARESHCGGVTVSFKSYEPLGPPLEGVASPAKYVKALQCLLQEKGMYTGEINGTYHSGVIRAVRSWQASRGFAEDDRWFRRDWMSLLVNGQQPVLKIGSAGAYVRRIQRALNAASLGKTVKADGVLAPATDQLVRTYQTKLGLPVTGVVDTTTWAKLKKGIRPGNARKHQRH